jgi:mxaL protein
VSHGSKRLLRLIEPLRARWRRHPDGWLLALGTLALAVTLLRPTLPVPEDLVHALLVIDVTQSMNVSDGHWEGALVTRGELARHAARGMLREVPCGSEIGLGIFNEYRTLVLLAPVEVCANFRELETTLDSIGNRMSWSGASEIAKGINSGFQSVDALPGKPAFVLFTDGHEAPPISMAHRPKIRGTPGEYAGVLVGTGSLRPQPIPKFDPDGNRIGYWRADEVAQVDIYSQGRESSVPGEGYAEDPADPVKPKPVAKPKAGQEHLSGLHEAYLQQLANETGLGYLRLDAPGQLLDAVRANRGSTRRTVNGDGRWPLALVALIALVASHVGRRSGAEWLGRARARLRDRRREGREPAKTASPAAQ